MKKILLSLMALMSGITMFAQANNHSFEFTDKDGNIIPDGSIITRNEVELDEIFETLQINSDLYVKNISANDTYVGLTCEIKDMPWGDFQICFNGACIAALQKFEYEASDYPFSKTLETQHIEKIAAGTAPLSTSSEWKLEEGKYGSFNIVYTINEYDSNNKTITSNGPSVTIKYIYSDPTGINETKENNATIKSIYNGSGQLVKGMQKGMNIIKMSDGTTIKIIK